MVKTGECEQHRCAMELNVAASLAQSAAEQPLKTFPDNTSSFSKEDIALKARLLSHFRTQAIF
ncbi:hypothetical protein CCR75_002916 [Bremia lactucae]|uniref:Uncharacterized protein n=1 Tax=Bremia lactucae TaxID=4779 RepID=A0A976FPP9_BRELC|nr:hypothetical protein CCR75_002916 [Bremia lactucae]